MRRIWILGLGALAVFLWWQPWRRWMQSGDNHHFDGRTAIMPAPTTSKEHSGSGNQFTNLVSSIPSLEQLSAKAADVASDAVENVKDAFASVDHAVSEGATNIQATVTDAADAAEGALAPAHAVAGEASDIAADAVKTALEASMPDQTTVDDIASSAQTAVADAIDAGKDAMTLPASAVSDIAATAEATVTNMADAATGELVPAHAVADEANDAVQAFSPNVEDETPAAVNSIASTSVTSAPDDLVIIEGVGPKISTVLTGAGIKTFAQLAETDEDTLLVLLKDAKIAGTSPATWARQARFAADGNWDELKQFQEQIKHGRMQS